MANNILDSLSLLPNYTAKDDVGIFTDGGVQLFREARTIKVRVMPTSKLMQHPAETGVTITDHRVINPRAIEMSMIIASKDYQSVYADIQQYYNSGMLLTVYCKAGIFYDMAIEAMPHDEDPEFQNSLLLVLKLQEVIYIKSKVAVEPKNPVNQTTVYRGVELPELGITIPPVDILARARETGRL